jgi:hypothetical protein
MQRSITAGILVVLLSATVNAQAPAKSEFLEQVQQHFEKWDTDHNGELTHEEIELAVTDPKVKGKAAAAAASMRRAIRANREFKPFTLKYLGESVPYKADAMPKPPKFEAMYETALERISTAKRELFVSDQPTVEVLSQGKLGDCFLLVTLGTAAANDPGKLKKMFKALPDDKVEVTFGDGRKMTMDMPTDAEICIGATNHNDGMWAVMFEKAIGTVYLERQKSAKHVSPLSIIGVGGTPNSPLELLTGHAIKRTGCEDFQNGKIANEADREKRLAEVRERLIEAVKNKRLIVGGTAPLGGKQTVVPGLYYNHSYGVLGYDEMADTVTFWNPFGNKYTPKSEVGLKNGYPTSNGKFTMPLTDAVMWFGSFSIETSEPSKRTD